MLLIIFGYSRLGKSRPVLSRKTLRTRLNDLTADPSPTGNCQTFPFPRKKIKKNCVTKKLLIYLRNLKVTYYAKRNQKRMDL
jgi:hypothetical protein